MSLTSIKGAVAYIQHRYSIDCDFSSYQSIECNRTSAVVAKSSETSAGRINGTSAPYCSATSAISASSVDTMTLSNHPDANAASIEYAMIGFPLKSLIFFRGMRLLPPRAGIIAIFITHLLEYQLIRRQPYSVELPSYRGTSAEKSLRDSTVRIQGTPLQ